MLVIQPHQIPKDWTTEHKESTAQFPRLNTDPATATKLTAEVLKTCAAVRSFTIKDSNGNTLSQADMERTEWDNPLDFAEPAAPDPLDELADQVKELQDEKVTMLRRIDALEKAMKAYGKRKVSTIPDESLDGPVGHWVYD